MRARTRLLDYLEGLMMHVLEAPVRVNGDDENPDAGALARSFVCQLCTFLRDNKALIAGSAAVHAAIGSPTWQPADVDIFILESAAQPNYRLRMERLLLFYLPTGFALSVPEADQASLGDYSPTVTKSVYTYKIGHWRGEFNALAKFQIVELDSQYAMATPFCEDLSALLFHQRLYELFDIKLCASYFDGTDFHTVDYHWAVRGVSRVVPTGTRPAPDAPFIAGKTPRLQRPYLLAPHSGGSVPNPNCFARADFLFWRGWLKPKENFVRVLAEWMEVNKQCGWPDGYMQLTRLRRYLDRDVTLFLTTPYALAGSKVTILDSRGLLGNVSQALVKHRYTCEWK
jgi:hypothetical protein